MITLVLAMCIGIMIGTLINCAFDKELDKLADFAIYKFKELNKSFRRWRATVRVPSDQGVIDDNRSQEKLSV